MGMTKRLKQLGWLNPGNVEKTIESVEESKFQMRKDSENLNVEQQYFMNLFEEKFPKVLENISLLGEQLYGIDKESWSFESLESPKTYHPGIANWEKLYNFGINFKPLTGWRQDYIKFTFNKQSKELEEIAIKGEEIAKPLSPFKGKTIKEFCEKYFHLVKTNLVHESSKHQYMPAEDLVHLLNKVPEYIESMYRGMEYSKKEKLKELEHTNGSLEDLEVTDFVF